MARKKVYMDDNPKTGSWKWRQVFLYRLSSAYLDYAEALNEAYDNTASREEALEYVNKIRERAGVRKYILNGSSDDQYIHADDSQEAVRKLIRMERRVELCCEGSRWMDIRRWKIAEELPEVCGDDYGMDYGATDANGFYKRTVFQTRVWRNHIIGFRSLLMK